MLLNYTDGSQQNILMKADSSTGKTYLVTEVAYLFPQKDKILLFNCSPTAFIYEYGVYDEEKNMMEINLHQKLLILLDQRNLALLKELRPLLSHDEKELITKRTDKKKRAGHATKTIKLIGYPTFIVCNASHKLLDEQELTRAFIISPETTQEKLKDSLRILTQRLGDSHFFNYNLDQNNERLALMARITKIAGLKISDIIIPEDLRIRLFNGFVDGHGYLTPRNMRDYPRLIALIKAHTLLNAEHREIKEIGSEKHLIANETDFNQGLQAYSHISESNELGLSPEIYEIWENIVQPNLEPFLTRTIIRQFYWKQYHRNLSARKCKEVLETLVAVGLIIEEPDPNDRRQKIYCEALK